MHHLEALLKRFGVLAGVLAIFASFSSECVWADEGDIEVLNRQSFTVSGTDAQSRVDAAIVRIADILRAYRPASVGYSNYLVVDAGPQSWPRMSFLADVAVFGIHQKGVLIADVSYKAAECARGWRVTMDLRESDPKISNQISNYIVELCPKITTADGVVFETSGTMIEGPRYKFPFGPAARGIFTSQLKAVIQGLMDCLAR